MKRHWNVADSHHARKKLDRIGDRLGGIRDYPAFRKIGRKGHEETFKLAQFSVENSADAIFWITPSGGFYYVNKAACQELGYTRDELERLHVWDIDPQYPKERWPATWARTKAKGSVKFETVHKTKAGNLIDVEIIGNYIRYDDAEFSCAFSRDITDRKAAEDAVQESERKFRAIFDETYQYLGLLTVDGILLDVNRAALEAIGVPKSAIIGTQFWETPWCTYTDEIRENIRDSIVRAGRGEFVRFETTFRDIHGKLLRIDYSIKPIYGENGEINLLIPEGRDITDRKRAEDALRESEEKFRVLSETSAVAIFIYQGDRFVSVNKATLGLTGYSKDELLNMKFLNIVHPDDRKFVYDRSQARQRGEQIPPRYEFKLLMKGGAVKWVEINAGRIMYKGKPAGVATLFDITDRKQAVEALSAAKAQSELYLDLMSHDINNMNQSASGYLEMALQNVENGECITTDKKYLIEKPLKTLNGSSMLIDNVRKLQRLMIEGIRTMPVDLGEIFEKLDLAGLVPDNRQVTFNIAAIPHVRVEANELLTDVFTNLITNAIKHSCMDRPLAVAVSVETVRENGHAYYRCVVEDDGQGISNELKSKLFRRFQRGKTGATGKGLGLYLVKTLVEGYGGKVWVEDRVPGDHSKGARFVVLLPEARKTEK